MRYRPNVAVMLAAAVCTVVLGGCASTPALRSLKARQQKLTASGTHKPAASVSEVDANYVAASPVRYVAPHHAVSIRAHGVALAQVLHEALPRGYSLSFEQGVKPQQPISVEIGHTGRFDALRRIALAGGAVIVVHRKRREVIVAQQATYFYHVPAGLLGKAAAALDVSSSTTLKSNSASEGGSSSSSGMYGSSGGAAPGSTPSGGAGGTSSSGNGASFSVSANTSKSGFVSALKQLVGSGGHVSVDPRLGQVAVSAGAGGLARAGSYIRHYVGEASTQVEIHAAILEVDLSESLSSGIQWSKVLKHFSASLNAAAPSPAQVVSASGAAATFSIAHTGASLQAVIKALQSVSHVRVLTEPWLSTANGMPATINSGTQVPYVGEITNNVSGLSGTSTVGSSLSYANNGVALSFIPQVLNAHRVQMTVVPSLSTIQSFKTFTVNGETLEGPVLQQRQAYVRLQAKPDQTVILGGSITRSANTQSKGVPWLSRLPVLGPLFGAYGEGHSRSQLVILVRAHVVHAPSGNPLVGESL